MAAENSPFYIRPPNVYEALISGVGGYDRAQKSMRESERDAILQEVGQEVARGGISDTALGKLFGLSGGAGVPALNAAANLQKSKMEAQGVYGTPIWGERADGTPVLLAIGKQGQGREVPMPEGVTPTPGTKMVDSGLEQFPISSKSGRRMQQAPTAQFGGPDTAPVKIPQGMLPEHVAQRYRPGTPIILPDGRQGVVPGQPTQGAISYPKDVQGEAREKKVGAERGEMIANKGKAKFALDASVSQLDRMEKYAARIKNNPALSRVTGIMGVVPNWPGSKAADVQGDIKSLKPQVGFAVLQAMRDASKTGGALGQVSERENVYLQDALASFDQLQSAGKFKEAMDLIVDYSRSAKVRLQDAYKQDYGSLP